MKKYFTRMREIFFSKEKVIHTKIVFIIVVMHNVRDNKVKSVSVLAR